MKAERTGNRLGFEYSALLQVKRSQVGLPPLCEVFAFTSSKLKRFSEVDVKPRRMESKTAVERWPIGTRFELVRASGSTPVLSTMEGKLARS